VTATFCFSILDVDVPFLSPWSPMIFTDYSKTFNSFRLQYTDLKCWHIGNQTRKTKYGV
jgi:hypothetical protein